MNIENKTKHSFRPVLWLRQLATINFQRAKIDEYEQIIKDKLWEKFVKWKNEPSENESLKRENKRLQTNWSRISAYRKNRSEQIVKT
jgi:hypothetical protein